MKTILILDSNNIAHRVRHVFSLSRRDGVDTSVTYGFLHNLRALVKKFEPDACIAAWDGGIPEFRRAKLPSYKSNRHHDDDDTYQDFIRQMNELQTEILPLAGVLNVMRYGVEADDIMYHAAFLSMFDYTRVIIVSGDEDLIQAVNLPDVFVYNTSKKVLIDEDYVQKEYGISVRDFVHWKALQGDGSDAIKGVPGIGPKNATKLFQKYKSLSNIVNSSAANARSPMWKGVTPIKGKMAENIREFGIEQLSKNVYVMALYADRTGSRLALLDDSEHYQLADIVSLKKFMIRNEFVSLMEGSFFKPLKRLSKPMLATDLRTPVICCRRFPIEEES